MLTCSFLNSLYAGELFHESLSFASSFFNINFSADYTRKQRVKIIVWFVMSQTGGNIRLQYHSQKGDQSFIKHNYFL